MVAMKKRGNIGDVLYTVGAFFALVITVIAVSYVLSQYAPAIGDADEFGGVANRTVTAYESKLADRFDAGLLLAFIGLHLGVIILAILLPSHPVLYPVMFIALIIVVILSGFVANAYNEFAEDPDFVLTAKEFPITDWIMSNFVVLNLVIGFIDIIAFLAIRSTDAGGGVG